MTGASINVTISPCSRSLSFILYQGLRGINGGWGMGTRPFLVFWLPCLCSACPGSADVPLPSGEALWGGQDVREIGVHCGAPLSGVLRCSTEAGAPCIYLLLSDWLGSSLAAKIALLGSQKTSAWCRYRPVLGRVVMSSEHRESSGREKGFFGCGFDCFS